MILDGRRAILLMHGSRKEMKRGTVAAIKMQLGAKRGLNACLSSNFDPDPDGGFTVTFHDVPEAITEGDSREEALLRAEDALESALAMYIAAEQPIPAPSKAEAG